MTILLRCLILLLCCFYAYGKLLNLQSTLLKKRLHIFLLSGALSLIYLLSKTYLPQIAPLLLILCLYLSVLIIYRTRPELSLVAVMISYGICYALYTLSTLLITLLVTPFYYQKTNYPLTFLVITSCLLLCLFVYLLFRVRRLRNGISFLYQNKITNAGLLLSFLILSLITFDQYKQTASSLILACLPLGILLFAFFLLLWWRSHITGAYIEKLRKAELESLQNELEEKETTIARLKEDNAELARLIHKDNKLIPAMADAVTEYLEKCAGLYTGDKGDELLLRLKSMTQERYGILSARQEKGGTLPQTGVCSIDALFSYMVKKAEGLHITLTLHIQTDVPAMVSSHLPESDFTHLLADVLENAIIAAKKQSSGLISVSIGKLSDAPIIEVADNGIAFPAASLQSFGLQSYTSHAGDGGSGIGLVDIWKLKKKYRMSLHIQEYCICPDREHPFTKKLTFSLDGKDHYIIQTYRWQELIQIQSRSDLYILPKQAQ